MNQKFRGRNLFRASTSRRTSSASPWSASSGASCSTPTSGSSTTTSACSGCPTTSPGLPRCRRRGSPLVGVTVWWTLGFNAVIYLAGLQDIPQELYEAAEVDGASAWQRFRNVTLPGLRPVTMFVTMITIIASANMFGQSYLMTKGAPGTETRTAIYQIAETGLKQFQMGSARR